MSSSSLLFACVYFEDASFPEDERIRFAESCFRFSSQIALRGTEAVVLEVGKSRRLFSQASLQLRLQALLRRWKTQARISFASDPATALAMARFGCVDSSRLPLEALSFYVSPFCWSEETQKLTEKTLSCLKKLKVSCLEDFKRLPLEAWASRFGKEVAEAASFLHGRRSWAWPGFHPAVEVLEQTDLCDPETRSSCWNWESLSFPAKTCLDRLMARLFARGEVLCALELTLGLEDRSKQSWKFSFSTPQSSVRDLLRFLQDRVGFELDRKRLSCPVVFIQVQVLETMPGRSRQKDFFSSIEEQREAWESVFERLSQKLGKARVFLAELEDRHLPEGAWKICLQPDVSMPKQGFQITEKAPAAPTAPRPSRVLKAPVPVYWEENRIWSKGALGKISGAGKTAGAWTICKMEGPERISGEWWKPGSLGFDRDYYRVWSESGESLWVFFSQSQAYLHGFFD